MKRYKFFTVNARVRENTLEEIFNFKPDNGKIIGVLAFPDSAQKAENALVSLGIFDNQNIPIVPNLNLSVFQSKNTAWENSFFPLDINANGSSFSLKLRVPIAINNLLGHINGYVIEIPVTFIYETQN